MADDNFSRTFFLGSLFVLFVLTAIIVFPLITVILSAGIIAYILNPLYKKLAAKINKPIAAWLVVILVIVLLTVPTYYVAKSLTKEGYSFFLTAKQKLATGLIEVQDCTANPKPFCDLTNSLAIYLKDPQTKYYIENSVSKFSNYVIQKGSDFIVNIPTLAVDLFILLFALYYFLTEGTVLLKNAKKSIPLKTHHIDHIIAEFDNFTYATIYGHLITAVAQGIVGGFVFFFLGLPTPILAGLGMTFFGFIPFLGTPIVWLPVAFGLFITGETTKAILLILLGTFVISTIDNILRPFIVGKRTNLPAVAVLIGIFGGMYTLGIIGILAGPLILSLLISFIDVYYKEGY